MKTGIVILAAGESTRMGEPKQVLTYRGRTLLAHAIDTAHSVPGAPVAVVLGAHAAMIRTRIDDARVIVAENPDWREGMGGSLRTGLAALLAAHADLSALIVLLCDQPLVPADTLQALIATHRRTTRAIVASEYGGALGVPAFFAKSMFPELLVLAGNEGARQIINSHRERVAAVAVPDGAFDIDTPADYARLRIAFHEVPTPCTA